MTDHGSSGIGWKIAFFVLLTALVAAGATYLVLEAQRPAPVAVSEAPAAATPDSVVPQATPDRVDGDPPGDTDGIELPPLTGNDLASQRIREAADNWATSDRQEPDYPTGPITATEPEPTVPPDPATPANPRLRAARAALANGELQRGVEILDELEASDAWTNSGEIKVLEEDVLARLESAETVLSGEQRQRIQEALTLLGYDTRGVDGIFGRGTRSAIRDYQDARDDRPTGYLTEVQLSQLLGRANERRRQLAEQQQNQEQQRQARILAVRDEAEQLLRAGNLETGLAVVREGLELEPDNPELLALRENLDLRLQETRLNLSQAERQRVQRTLDQLGYSARDPAGEFGRSTRSAIAAYQRAIGQPSTGYLTEPLVAQLLRNDQQNEQDAALREQEQIAELKAATRDLLARADPYRDETVLRQQLARVVEATGRHPQDQALVGLELALRARLEEVGLGLSAGQRQAVQRDLSRLGFDTRGADGHFGPGTREAVAAYQRSRGMPTTGYLSPPLLEQLWQDAQSLPGDSTATTEQPPRQFPADDPRELLDALERELRSMQEQVTGQRREIQQRTPTTRVAPKASNESPTGAPKASSESSPVGAETPSAGGQAVIQDSPSQSATETARAAQDALRQRAKRVSAGEAAASGGDQGTAEIPLPTPQLQSPSSQDGGEDATR